MHACAHIASCVSGDVLAHPNFQMARTGGTADKLLEHRHAQVIRQHFRFIIADAFNRLSRTYCSQVAMSLMSNDC